MQRLGQHFLINKSAVNNTIATLDLQSGDKLIEIGPGTGKLTLPLVEKIKELSGNLRVIEKDSKLIPPLSRAVDNLFKTRNESAKVFKIVAGDALKKLPELIKAKYPESIWKLVGNIPYYITGHLLRIIGGLSNKPKIAVLMVQKEVAERLAASPSETELTAKNPKGGMSLLAAATGIWADITIIQTLKPEDFDPPPEVESAIICLKTKDTGLKAEELEGYYKFIKIIFKQPRKTLLNNLSGGYNSDKAEILSVLRQFDYDEKTRAQNLPISEIIKLSNSFANR